MKREVKLENQSKNQNLGGAKNKNGGEKVDFKRKMRRARNRFLMTYYGAPTQELKVICVTGSTGKVTVARYVHEILKATGIHSAVLASEETIKAAVLYKFLGDAWKEKATYAVVTAPAGALGEDVFYGVPIAVAALTNFVPSGLSDPEVKEYLETKKILFRMDPEVVVLNRDDKHYEEFAEFRGAKDTLTFGQDNLATVRIDHSKLYKMGAEAGLAVGSKSFMVATFVPGETAVSLMACAAAIATALMVAPDSIAEGIGNLEV